MELRDLTKAELDLAAPKLGGGPVTMVNQLWFRSEVAYADDAATRQPDPRSALYKGYAVAFVEIAQELGVQGVEAVFIGQRKAGLVSTPEDNWDELVIVRYGSFADFRKIVESEQYARRAKPHHKAAIANWRLTAYTA